MADQLQVGDVVRHRDPQGLHCATQVYGAAVVASVSPLVLVSDCGDMRWSQVKAAAHNGRGPDRAVAIYTAAQVEEIRRAAILQERERCAKVCEAESTAHGGVAAGPMTTERGKLVYESMAVGAKNCAAAIREGDK